jgi:predicted GIY-YIG superfamily endonuclease
VKQIRRRWENSDKERMTHTLPPRDAEIAEQRDEISRIVSSTRDDSGRENIVYVLQCRTPENEAELQEFKKSVNAFTEYSTYDIKALVAEEIYYVGWTNRPIGRILDHLRAEEEGAQFTKVYQPIAIEEIRWFESSEAAKKAEGSVAGEYNQYRSDEKSVDLSSLEAGGEELAWSDIVAEINQFEHPRSFAYSL